MVTTKPERPCACGIAGVDLCDYCNGMKRFDPEDAQDIRDAAELEAYKQAREMVVAGLY